MSPTTSAILQVLIALLAWMQAPVMQATAQPLKRSLTIKEHPVYRDFVPLSAENLTEIAMKDEQAWVIHVHDEFLDPEVKMTAEKHRGLVRFGLVSAKDRPAVELMKFDPSRHFFRALPFGWETRKTNRLLDTEGFLAALEHAASSVPDDFINVVRTEQETKALLAEAIGSRPSKFTVLFTAKDAQPTLLHRVLSRKLIRNFNFALLPHADADSALKNAGLAGLTIPVPGMAVLMVTSTGAVRSSRPPEPGRLQYPEALRFLVEFNRQFRPDLPGDSRSSDPQVLYMRDVLEAERLVFQVDDAADGLDAAETGDEAAPEDPEDSQEDTAGEDLKEEL